MKKTTSFLTIFQTLILSLIYLVCALSSNCSAQPYGKGLYGIIKYGDQTSLSISTNGNVNIQITPDTNGVLATGSSNVTVTSTDVMGYKLYIRTLSSTNMDNLGTPLPTTSNVTLLPLAVNTWGYNTDASSNFLRMNLTDTIIKSVTSPTPSGDATTVTYGLKLDMSKPAGNYTSSVVYTAVPQTD